MSKTDKAEEQRNRVEKELVELTHYAQRMTVAYLLRALEPKDGINWVELARAAHFAGGADALRAARDCNDGNGGKLTR